MGIVEPKAIFTVPNINMTPGIANKTYLVGNCHEPRCNVYVGICADLVLVYWLRNVAFPKTLFVVGFTDYQQILM